MLFTRKANLARFLYFQKINFHNHSFFSQNFFTKNVSEKFKDWKNFVFWECHESSESFHSKVFKISLIGTFLEGSWKFLGKVLKDSSNILGTFWEDSWNILERFLEKSCNILRTFWNFLRIFLEHSLNNPQLFRKRHSRGSNEWLASKLWVKNLNWKAALENCSTDFAQHFIEWILKLEIISQSSLFEFKIS